MSYGGSGLSLHRSYGSNYTSRPSVSSRDRLYEGTSQRTSRNLVGHQKTMLEKQPTFSSKSIYSQSLTNKYQSTYRDSHSRYGRGARDELVRPSTRSHSTTRGSMSRRIDSCREKSLPRENLTEYPSLTKPRPNYVKESRTSYNLTVPVPEFTTIQSPNRKTSRRQNYSSTLSEGKSLSNGYVPSQKIEISRTIHQSESSPVKATFTPSFARNLTNNNNNSEESGSSRSSSSGKHTDFVLEQKNASTSVTKEITSTNAGLVGLRNIGNTCFMNSILQCLSNTKPLRDYCLEKKYKNEINRQSPTKGKLMEAFSDILLELWFPSSIGTAISTSSFKSQVQKVSSRFTGYDQQDCQEFLRFLIEGLHEDVNRITRKHKDAMPNFDTLCDESKAEKTWNFYLKKDDSYIVDLFMGQLKSSLKCAECHNVSTTFDPFWDLSLPIAKGSYYGERLNLQHCLESFTREETLEGDERPTCDKCKARRRMTKRFTIYRLPKILVIHLKRFNEGQRFRQKLSNDVEFPHRLDLDSSTSTSPATFNLYAVSNHSGSCYGGHYTAYCKNPQTREWHSFSDSHVSSMSSSSVQSKEAYVLFYEMTSSRSRSHL